MEATTTETAEIVQALQAMKAEHEHNSAAIVAYEKQQQAGAHLLTERREAISRVRAEVGQIAAKTEHSAGSVRQLDEMLESERAELASLESEISRLGETVTAVVAELEQLQARSMEASKASAARASALQLEWRERRRTDKTVALALLCSLKVLEREACARTVELEALPLAGAMA
jgi:chromosome segregation ATPase